MIFKDQSSEDSNGSAEIRAKISSTQKSRLHNIAENLGCTLNGKVSITALMTEIADGNIKPIDNRDIERTPEIQLTIEVSVNLAGIMEQVTKIIKDREINMFRILASEDSNVAKIYIIPNSENETSLEKSELILLAEDLYKLTIKDVFERNKDIYEKLVLITQRYDLFRPGLIDELLFELGREKLLEKLQERIKESNILKMQLVTSVYYIFRFTFSIENKIGTLYDVINKISDFNITMIKAEVIYPDAYRDKDYNGAFITLGFYPSRLEKNNIMQIILEIKKIINASVHVKEGSVKLTHF